MQTAQPPLAPPVATLSPTKGTKKGRPFNVLQHWGHLSPWYSTDHGLGGGDATSIAPAGCEIVGVHWLQRHGARYPTLSGEGPAALGERIAKAKAETEGGDLGAKGALSFLNDWTYKLGAEILTPFGRQQLCEVMRAICPSSRANGSLDRSQPRRCSSPQVWLFT